jgi:hypothetical protein
MELADLLRSCEQVSLTGFAEIKWKGAIGMVFFYLGAEANAVFREGTVAFSGREALERLATQLPAQEAFVTVFELPLDMAHLLRGIVNRRKLPQPFEGPSGLVEELGRLEATNHTGTLEVQTKQGASMMLMVNGRVSNTYFETPDGTTFEKKEARAKLDEALAAGPAPGFISEFSRDVWRGRHEVPSARERATTDWRSASAEKLAAEEQQTRNQILDELQGQVPALLQAIIIDLMTGSVLARRTRGTEALRVSLIADSVPSLTQHIRDLAAVGDDAVEMIAVSSEQVSTVVAIVPEAQEAIAVIAEKSQPTALIGGALSRLASVYKARLHPARGGAISA